MHTIPQTLNGHPVIGALPRPRSASDCLLVMVKRSGNTHHPYVVASWAPDCGTSWVWGQYFGTYPEALTYMTNRALGMSPADA